MASTAAEVTRGFAYVGDAEADHDQVTRTIETATPAVLGKVKDDEFLNWWRTVIDTGKVDPRDEAHARWLIAAETVGAYPAR